MPSHERRKAIAMRGDPGVVQDAFSEVCDRSVGCLYAELAIHHGL